jgi:hypothetical protein
MPVIKPTWICQVSAVGKQFKRTDLLPGLISCFDRLRVFPAMPGRFIVLSGFVLFC